MPESDKSYFEGPSQISATLAKKLIIADEDTAVVSGLKKFKWTGKTTGVVVLSLAADNSRIDAGTFGVRGPLAAKELRWAACDIWKGAQRDVYLRFKVPEGERFNFSDGGLCSDYLSMEEIECACEVTEDDGSPTQIEAGDWSEWGAGQFCLRLVASLQKATHRSGVVLKYWVLLYPGSQEEIMEVSELAQNASWPGIRVTEGEMSLLPTGGKAWACPVLPFLLARTPLHQADGFPTSAEMARCIAAIMARSAAADPYPDKTGVLQRWQRFANHPDEFTPRDSNLIWPAAAPEQPESGMVIKLQDLSRENNKW